MQLYLQNVYLLKVSQIKHKIDFIKVQFWQELPWQRLWGFAGFKWCTSRRLFRN